MKVLLKEDVSNLGYAGEVMDVADGYGRNYLIPQGKAVKATPGALTAAKTWRERAEVRLAELRKEHEALAERISKASLNFYALAGESGKLYGSVTTNDVVDALNKELGTSVERRAIVGDPLRQLGEHQVTVRLSRDYQPQIMVYIHPEGDELEDEAVEDLEDEAVEDIEAEAETVAEVETDVEEEAVVDAEADMDTEFEPEEESAEAEETEPVS